jgi:hypothetical protein
LPAAGHLVVGEQPHECSAILVQFLEDHSWHSGAALAKEASERARDST